MFKVKSTRPSFSLFLASIILAACGKSDTPSPEIPVHSMNEVVLSSSQYQLSVGDPLRTELEEIRNPNRVSRDSENSSPSMTLDTSLFKIPTITPFAVNDFGYLQISALSATKLNVCGSFGISRCTTAGIRIYTINTTSAGLWNTTDQVGAPITAGQTSSSMQTVGLNSSAAAVVQTISISSKAKSLSLSDFPNPKYDVKVDFTAAPQGKYSTTIVVEFYLN